MPLLEGRGQDLVRHVRHGRAELSGPRRHGAHEAKQAAFQLLGVEIAHHVDLEVACDTHKGAGGDRRGVKILDRSAGSTSPTTLTLRLPVAHKGRAHQEGGENSLQVKRVPPLTKRAHTACFSSGTAVSMPSGHRHIFLRPHPPPPNFPLSPHLHVSAPAPPPPCPPAVVTFSYAPISPHPN